MDYIDEHKRIPEGQIKQRLHGQNPATADAGADVLAQNRVVDSYGISYVVPSVHRTWTFLNTLSSNDPKVLGFR